MKRKFITCIQGFRIGFLIAALATGASVGAQETFVDELNLASSSTASSSSIATGASTVVVAQATSSGAVETASEETNEEVPPGETTNDSAESVEYLPNRYTLPTSAAPVAVDSSLKTTSPIGYNTQSSLSRPKGVRLDSDSGFFPSLTIGVSHQENPGREPGEDDASDTAVSIIPQLVYRSAINNRHAYEVGVAANTESFDELTYLDYDTWSAFAAVNLNMTEKLQADLYADYTSGADGRGGSASRTLDPGEPDDEYENTTVGGRLTFGRRSNPLQFVLRAAASEWDYTNNDQGIRDRNDTLVGGGIYWNVSPRTSLFWNVDQTDYDYVTDTGYDSVEVSNTVGIGWEPSYYTSLIFQIGNLNKDMESPALEDYDSDTYFGRFNWSPVDRFNIGLYASKLTEESISFGSPFIVSDLIGIDFTYSFTDRFSAGGYYNNIDDDYVDLRQDQIDDYGLGVYYDLTRWMSLGAGWSHTNRTSTDPSAEYDFNRYFLTLTMQANKPVNFRSSNNGDNIIGQ